MKSIKFYKLIFLSSAMFLIGIHSISAQLSGTYTINKANPTGSGNYNSFADATSALKANGVMGAVTFNVVANSGPYYEQVQIDTISGVNPVNTITFKGHGNTIATNVDAANRSIIKLNGANYVTFDSLTLYDSSTTFGWGVHLIAGANYNTISNCIINLTAVTSTSSSNAVGIIATGSTGNTTTAGNNANYCTFINNTIMGGSTGTYYGIRLNGNTGGLNCVGNKIINNTIQDIYSYNIYLDDTDSTLVEGNDISRPNKVTVSSFYAIYLTSGNRNARITKNRIHNSHDASSSKTGAAYCIYLSSSDAPAGSPNIVDNNIIYNINSNGTIYALYNLGSDRGYFYYNTVSLDHTSATGGTTRGFYQSSTATDVIFKNNNISITRGGSGTKHAIYLNTSTSTITCDNNNLYVNSSGSGSQYTGRHNSTDYATLANWQTANSGAYGQNSVAADPLYSNPSSGVYKPASPALDGIASPVAGISTDIDGITRHATTPDPGAYEFTPPQDDAGIVAITSPNAPCPGTANVTVNLKNFGAVSLDSVRIHWSLNGLAQTATNYSNAIASGNDTLVTIGSFSVVAGNFYDIVAWTSFPNGNSNDANNLNDTAKLLNVESAMTGIYTISSTGDYTTIVSAVNDLNNRGVCGPVTFNVSNATYFGKFTIGPILGTSMTNTVTFNGGGSTISDSADASNRQIVSFDNASHITLDSFIITSTSADYGWGVHLMNASNYNTISNCTIDLTSVTSTASTQANGIVASGSKTSATTGGNNASYCTIINNTILGGTTGVYYGIRFNGLTGGLNCVGNKIINNKVNDIYAYNIYLDDTDSSLVEGNEVSRAGKTGVSTFYGIYLTSGNRNALIHKNSLHNTHDNASSLTGSAYGFYFSGADAPAGSPNVVQNNLVYNFNGNGNAYGVYNSSSDGAHYYFNTISLDHTAATGGTTRGFYQTSTTADIIFQNNIISITRGGSGVKHGLYFNSSASTITSDYNDIYINSLGSGAQSYGRWSSVDYSTMLGWQGANSNAFDQNSDSLTPEFMDIANDNYTPNSFDINNGATPVVGITDDFYGMMRNATTPDFGAIEFTPIPINDSCANAIPVTAGSVNGITTGSSQDMVPSCGTSIDSAGGVWYMYSASGDFVEASLCGSTFDTKISIYTGICDSLICVTGNDDSCGTQSVVGWCADDATDYYILIHGSGTAQGDFTLTITETPVVQPSISVSPDTVFCEEDSAVLTSTMAVEYLWNDLIQSTTPSITVGSSGSWAVTTTDSNGCMSTSDTVYTIANPLPIVFLGEDTTICDVASITLDAGPGTSYLWSTGATTRTITYDGSNGNATISVTVTDANGCEGTDEIEIDVDICSGISENSGNSSINVFPNPNEGNFVLDYSTITDARFILIILDIKGQIVYNEQVIRNNNQRIEINLNNLDEGLYFIQIQSETVVYTEKLIIK